jgi:hypothetical protein
MMNKIISIPCYQGQIYSAYTNKKIQAPKKIKTDTVKQKQTREPEPLEDLMDYIYRNPFRVLFSGFFKNKRRNKNARNILRHTQNKASNGL